MILNKGISIWNKWRKKNPDIFINLQDVDLRDMFLAEVNLSGNGLQAQRFLGYILGQVISTGDEIMENEIKGGAYNIVDLSRANLAHVDLSRANLCGTYFVEANFLGANLQGSELSGANLKGCNLEGVNLTWANLTEVNLKGANLKGAIFGDTILGSIDLRKTKGLEEALHINSSMISTSTLDKSRGKIPEKFLRGCGLSDWQIESAKLCESGLSNHEIENTFSRAHRLRAGQPIQITPLFISYNHRDSSFVDEIEKKLDEKGIRFWRYIHDATAGRLEKVIDRAIRQNPIVLLVLSMNSVQSDWVEHEAASARELEKELKRDVLCPVALDDAWKTCDWPAVLRRQIMDYNVLDFSKWEDEAEFTKMLRKLMDGLDLFYKDL